MRALALLTFLALLAKGPAFAQEATWEGWGKAMAERLAPYLPERVSSLIDRLPWEAPSQWPESGIACGGEGGGECPFFFPVRVQRGWAINDPALFQEIEEAKRQVETEVDVLIQQRTAIGKLQQESWKRIEELGRQGKHQEAMKLSDSLANDPEMKKLDAKLKELENRVPNLRKRARRVMVIIEANVTAEDVFDPGGNVGTLKGYPLYRVAWDAEKNLRFARLAVYLGPRGFKNPARKPGEQMRGEVKCFLLRVEMTTTPKDQGSDEALARQMLEKVNYAGLAKLLQP